MARTRPARRTGAVSQVAAQTTADAQRFADLGVPAARIAVTGNLKADMTIADGVLENGRRLRTQLAPQRPVWVAGSTHEIEEQQVLQAQRAVRQTHPAALLVLVPRHPRRFAAVADGCSANRSRSCGYRGAAHHRRREVLLVDAMGRLLDFYAAGDVAFVGGSLVEVGGHNLLEPAALSRPVLTGPHHANARDVLQALQAADAVRVVSDGAQLGRVVAQLLADAGGASAWEPGRCRSWQPVAAPAHAPWSCWRRCWRLPLCRRRPRRDRTVLGRGQPLVDFDQGRAVQGTGGEAQADDVVQIVVPRLRIFGLRLNQACRSCRTSTAVRVPTS